MESHSNSTYPGLAALRTPGSPVMGRQAGFVEKLTTFMLMNPLAHCSLSSREHCRNGETAEYFFPSTGLQSEGSSHHLRFYSFDTVPWIRAEIVHPTRKLSEMLSLNLDSPKCLWGEIEPLDWLALFLTVFHGWSLWESWNHTFFTGNVLSCSFYLLHDYLQTDLS